MGSCGYVPEDVRIKQEIIELTSRLEKRWVLKKYFVK